MSVSLWPLCICAWVPACTCLHTHELVHTPQTHTENSNQNQNATVELPNSLNPSWVPCFRPMDQHLPRSTDAHGYNDSWWGLHHPPPPFITPGTISKKMLRGSGLQTMKKNNSGCRQCLLLLCLGRAVNWLAGLKVRVHFIGVVHTYLEFVVICLNLMCINTCTKVNFDDFSVEMPHVPFLPSFVTSEFLTLLARLWLWSITNYAHNFRLTLTWIRNINKPTRQAVLKNRIMCTYRPTDLFRSYLHLIKNHLISKLGY